MKKIASTLLVATVGGSGAGTSWLARRLFDLEKFLDCPEDQRLLRRLGRDTAERRKSPEAFRRRFRKVIAPMHRKYVAPQRQWADVVPTQRFKRPDSRKIANWLWALHRAQFGFSLLNARIL